MNIYKKTSKIVLELNGRSVIIKKISKRRIYLNALS